MKKPSVYLALLLLCALLCSCSPAPEPEPEPEPVVYRETYEGKITFVNDGLAPHEVVSISTPSGTVLLRMAETTLRSGHPAVGDRILAEVIYTDEDRSQPYPIRQYALTRRMVLQDTVHGFILSRSETAMTVETEDGEKIRLDLTTAEEIPEGLVPEDEIEATVEYDWDEKDKPFRVLSMEYIEPAPVIPDYPSVSYTQPVNPNALKDGDVTPRGFSVSVSNGATYVGGVLIANKTYSLPASYYPGGLTSACYSAFLDMQAGAEEDGISLWIVSGFRSFDTQYAIYWDYVYEDGQAEADTYSARPGHSEHQTGLAMDINSLKGAFADTAEGKWLADHAWEYGFILRYPKGKSGITGYIFEPWHYRYVGKEMAAAVYESGLTLEEYLGIDSVYYNG